MKRRSLVPTYALAGLLCGAGVVLLGSLVAHLAGVSSLPAAPPAWAAIAAPGRFLFSTFLWAAFFVPVYPIALAVLLLSRRFSPRRFGVLNLLLLPFVTVSLFHKVALHGSVPGSYLPDLLVAWLGRFPAAVLLFALVVLELLLILSLRGRARACAGAKAEEQEEPTRPKAPAAAAPAAQGPGGAEAGSGAGGGGRGDWRRRARSAGARSRRPMPARRQSALLRGAQARAQPEAAGCAPQADEAADSKDSPAPEGRRGAGRAEGRRSEPRHPKPRPRRASTASRPTAC